jgi:hypothetical protein
MCEESEQGARVVIMGKARRAKAGDEKTSSKKKSVR